MRVILFLLLSLSFFGLESNLFAQDKAKELVKFNKNVIDYGDVKKGENGVRIFEMVNLSDTPLIILNAESSCGCTVPDYPKKPIKKNNIASIKVVYDTNRVGPFTKTIKIYTNIKEEPYRLVIKGEVLDI